MANLGLRAPLNSFRTEAVWLQNEFLRAAAAAPEDCALLACEMVVVRLHDAWARFCREIVILSAAGGIVTKNGTYLRPSLPAIASRALVIPCLLATYRRRRYEPKWAVASECLDAAQRLRLANLATISAAIGASNSPADRIREVRNFYAHRTRETAARAMAAGYFSRTSKPSVFELASFSAGGRTIIESWISDLDSIADAATE